MGALIKSIEKEDIGHICNMADIIFAEFEISGVGNDLKYRADWSMSVKLIVDDILAGFYLFNKQQLNYPEFDGKNGVQGVALGVLKEYRGKGYGRLLIEKPYELFSNEYDYIWGMHLASLKNIDHWKKRRKMYNEKKGASIYLSYAFYNEI
jgi:GNAT superfamily N-acetyltransferase